MATVFKYIAQFLLLPLIKELIDSYLKARQAKNEEKKLKEENAKKGKAYEESSSDNAHGEFERLP